MIYVKLILTCPGNFLYLAICLWKSSVTFPGKNRKISLKILESPGIWKKNLCGHNLVLAKAFLSILTRTEGPFQWTTPKTLFHHCSYQTLKKRWYEACPLPGLGLGPCSLNQAFYQWTIQLFEIIVQYNL